MFLGTVSLKWGRRLAFYELGAPALFVLLRPKGLFLGKYRLQLLVREPQPVSVRIVLEFVRWSVWFARYKIPYDDKHNVEELGQQDLSQTL